MKMYGGEGGKAAGMASISHSLQMRAVDPRTPLHSPNHSVHSSTSSRLSLRNLTLHEYRKQQNSPASQSTPPGKTLRRKAAASGLNDVERVPSVSQTPLSARRPAPRPLHLAHPTHQVVSHQPLPPSPPHQQHELSPEKLIQPQTDEPYGSYSSAVKVREFKPIKRLPKPLSATLPVPAPSPLASVTSAHPRLSPLRTTCFPSFENSVSVDPHTTPTFSLSRFPRPPNLIDPSLSPPRDEHEPPRLNVASFSSTAPATPPATPAVIHYRGASFDLINPHSSLVLENIVTPSRDLESTDYVLLGSSDDGFGVSEMAPKRPLYNDLSSAYSSIIRRHGDEYPPPVNYEMPLPPTPVAQSPGSSSYGSPFQSPESDLASSPVSVGKRANESRFSLKQLTRSLTKKLVKPHERTQDQELQDLSDARVRLASASFEGDFPRPLERSYRAVTPKSSLLPDEPPTPGLPPHSTTSQRSSIISSEQPLNSTQRFHSAPLASMVPDDPSSQLGRASHPRLFVPEGDLSTRPYYDDLDSIYPSSSVYTGDDRRQSNYPPSRSSNVQSNPYWRMSGGADVLANEYISQTGYEYPSSRRTSRRASRTLEQEMVHRSLKQGTDKTDTISKFIDEYKMAGSSDASQPMLDKSGEVHAEYLSSPSDVLDGPMQTERPDSTFNQFELDFAQHNMSSHDEVASLPVQAGRVGKLAIATNPGSPPSIPAPLAPAFEYDDNFDSPKRPDSSKMFPKFSSYGDTRQLLQLSQQVVGGALSAQPVVGEAIPGQPMLEPSSSYSQPETQSNKYISQEALEQAEEIFENAGSQQRTEAIPTIWARRSSGHLLRNRSNEDLDQYQAQHDQEEISELIGYEDKPEEISELPEYENEPEEISELPEYENGMDNADWETVANGSQRDFRASLGDSIADYSSSEDSHSSRDSMGFSGSFPAWEEPPLASGTFPYRHPQPMASHSNPFHSSPLPMLTSHSGRSAPEYGHTGPVTSSPLPSSTVPAFHGWNNSGVGLQQEPHSFTPWVNPYAFSDKETQELLASGPNEDIMYQAEAEAAGRNQAYGSQADSSSPHSGDLIVPMVATPNGGHDSHGLCRENTFEKLTVLGPKGNLTGTPRGTGMYEAGSSVADNSSRGARFGQSQSPDESDFSAFRSSASRSVIIRGGTPSFVASSRASIFSYDSPDLDTSPGRTGSVNRIVPPLTIPSSDSYSRTPSRATLSSQPNPESPFADPTPRGSRVSLRSPITPHRSRRTSRAAVTGQTKLRQMVLAPDTESSSSSGHSTNASRRFGTADSGRPSTSNTHTPLRFHASRVSMGRVRANMRSPHLLCPERATDPDEEEQRLKMSWAIFALFCIFPPALILYRWMGDLVIVNVTGGRLTHVSSTPKRVALGAGITVNVGITVAILLSILIPYAGGSL